MTAPKKPVKPTGRTKSVVANASLPALTTDEQELLAAYRGMVDEGRRVLLKVMKLTAARTPRHGRPALRLVVGGAT
jgi:hypothetical protein